MANTVRSGFALIPFIVLALAPLTSFAQTAPFNLPSQSLAESLKAVGSQSNINVMVSPALVDGRQAPALKAQLSTREALEKLLEGTGLEYYFVNDQTVVIREKTAPAAGKAPPKSQATDAHKTALTTMAQTDQREDQGVSTVEQSREHPKSPKSKQAESLSVEGDSDRGKLEEIIVTGTHIRGVAPSSPVIEITRDQIERSGYTTIGDVIRGLPQNFSGGNNPQVQVGNAPGGVANISPSGGSAPNLRGLGPASTLTLVNGSRLAQDTAVGAADISLIPLDEVERVEVVTDGASAIYGSDAVGGVVNVILKKDYTGAQTTASFGKATDGGADDRRIAQLLGTTWDSGGALLVYEHDKQGAVYSEQRDFTSDALTPYSLLPSSSRNSFAVTAHQNLSSRISAQLDGLFTSRSGYSVLTYPPTYADPYSVNQYVATGRLNAKLPYNWTATFLASASEQRTAYMTLSSIKNQFPEEDLEGRSRLVELNANGDLFDLPSGVVRVAVGAGYREENFKDADVGIAMPFSNGDRSDDYVFGELAIPIVAAHGGLGLERLDLTASGRYDRYSDVGSKSVPKIGIIYSPVDSVSLRASWGKSFRAPSLADAYGLRVVGLFRLPNPASPTGRSLVLAPEGGNPSLQPETATSRTAGFDYKPEWVKGLRLSVSYFDIAYSNRIGTIANLFTVLTDPANAAFVVSNAPSLALQQSLIANANGGLRNFSGAPYNPAAVAAIVNAGPVNISRQDISGVDLGVSYKKEYSASSMDLFLDGAYEELDQRFTPESPSQELAGQAFNPPKVRARGGMTWETHVWAATAVMNYLGSETNTYQPSLPHVASWTTIDTQLSYKPPVQGILSGLTASIAVQNIFNKEPPYLKFNTFRTGLNYDSLNASPLGRFVTLKFSEVW